MKIRDLPPLPVQDGFASAPGYPPPSELPQVPPTPAPASRPFWHRLLERKFILAVLVSVSGILALVSGAVPLSLEVVLWIGLPLLAWFGVESWLDLQRLKIPQVPGPLDDIARMLLTIGQRFGEDAAQKNKERAEAHALELERQRIALEQQRIWLERERTIPGGPDKGAGIGV